MQFKVPLYKVYHRGDSQGYMVVLCRVCAMHGKLCITAFCTAGLSGRAGMGWLPSKPHHCCVSVALFLPTGPMQQQVDLHISASFAPMHCTEVAIRCLCSWHKIERCKRIIKDVHAPEEEGLPQHLPHGTCACMAFFQNAQCMAQG